jgi:protein tyrosine phosphatase (PTP) superfamily phosphohydrolase (DUF442 family)
MFLDKIFLILSRYLFTAFLSFCCTVVFAENVRDQTEIRLIEVPYLQNVIVAAKDIYSGASPEGEDAFRSLQQLGIKTMISVDGATPDAAMAKRFAMRYVHLPHGYQGIPKQRVLEIAKALRELPKPIYVHCHHGKHRSPTAVAAATIALGYRTRDEGRTMMAIGGTNKDYRGLFATIDEIENCEAIDWDKVSSLFTEKSEVPRTASEMIDIDTRFAKLSQSGLPEKDFLYEVLMLEESFTELERTTQTETIQCPSDVDIKEYFALLASGAKLMKDFRLEATQSQSTMDQRQSLVSLLKNTCNACHQKFRDNVPIVDYPDRPR